MPSDPIYRQRPPEPDLLDVALQLDDTKPAPRKNAMAGERLETCLDDYCETGRLCDDCKRIRRKQASRIYQRAFYAKHPERSAESFRQWKYGLNPEAYRELLEKQGNACAICHRAGVRLTIDHDHATGAIRGILCHRCNSRLSALDDRAWVEEAEKYRSKG